MITKQQREIIISKIKYELEIGIHTFTLCSCLRHGARAEKCWECLLEDLA
jgi:hypothetical protein